MILATCTCADVVLDFGLRAFGCCSSLGGGRIFRGCDMTNATIAHGRVCVIHQYWNTSLAISFRRWRIFCFYNPVSSAGRLQTSLQRLIISEGKKKREREWRFPGRFASRPVTESSTRRTAVYLQSEWALTGLSHRTRCSHSPWLPTDRLCFWSSPYMELISNLLNHDDSINQRMWVFFFFFPVARCVAIFTVR